MNTIQRILIGGGVRCGKSAFAVARARQLGQRRTFIATAQALDDEMRQRIAEHRVARGADFATIEEPIELAAVLRRLTAVDTVVVDCLTLWLSNLLLCGESEGRILARVDELGTVFERVPFHAILVTNEVGMGVHPEHALGRSFRDVAGRAHVRLARSANEIYFAALGVMLRLRPSPVVVVPLAHAS